MRALTYTSLASYPGAQGAISQNLMLKSDIPERLAGYEANTSCTQLTRNITSDYISRLPHRSVPGPLALSLSPFSSSAFLRILYHFRERGPGYVYTYTRLGDNVRPAPQRKRRQRSSEVNCADNRRYVRRLIALR